MWGAEVARQARLPLEARDHDPVLRQLRPQDLQRDARALLVPRCEHEPGRALSEQLLEPVPADDLPRSRELAHASDYPRASMIRFRLLGPAEALSESGPVKLPGGKPRALLVRLLLEPGRVVPVDVLVDELWREPPASAHKVVQVYVSQLRKALGADAIETRAPGYLAPAGTEGSDLGSSSVPIEHALHARHPAELGARGTEIAAGRDGCGSWSSRTCIRRIIWAATSFRAAT